MVPRPLSRLILWYLVAQTCKRAKARSSSSVFRVGESQEVKRNWRIILCLLEIPRLANYQGWVKPAGVNNGNEVHLMVSRQRKTRFFLSICSIMETAMEGGKGGEKKIKFMAASLHTLSPSPLSFSLSLFLFCSLGWDIIRFKMAPRALNWVPLEWTNHHHFVRAGGVGEQIQRLCGL